MQGTTIEVYRRVLIIGEKDLAALAVIPDLTIADNLLPLIQTKRLTGIILDVVGNALQQWGHGGVINPLDDGAPLEVILHFLVGQLFSLIAHLQVLVFLVGRIASHLGDEGRSHHASGPSYP